MSPRKPLLFGIAAAVFAGTAQARVSRVFVSVNGNDANTCSNIATPCRTISGGITQVDAHGEVIVIDSGSYAGGTITKAVKIDVAAGAVAFSGLPITVNVASGSVVIRGLTLKAATNGAGSAITVLSGNLILENSVLDGWNTGIDFQSAGQELYVSNATFRNMSGVAVFADPANMTMTVENSRFFGNAYGLRLGGVDAFGRVVSCVFSGHTGSALITFTGATLEIKRTEVFRNGQGLYLSGGTMRLSDVSILGSTFYGILADGPDSVVFTNGNNELRNSIDLSGLLLTAASLQ